MLPEAGALQGRCRGVERRQFPGGEGNEAAQGVRPQPPMPPVVAAVLQFQRPEGRLHGVAQAFGRPPADRESVLDVGERHPVARSLKADGQAHDVRQPLVAHPALSGSRSGSTPGHHSGRGHTAERRGRHRREAWRRSERHQPRT